MINLTVVNPGQKKDVSYDRNQKILIYGHSPVLRQGRKRKINIIFGSPGLGKFIDDSLLREVVKIADQRRWKHVVIELEYVLEIGVILQVTNKDGHKQGGLQRRIVLKYVSFIDSTKDTGDVK